MIVKDICNSLDCQKIQIVLENIEIQSEDICSQATEKSTESKQRKVEIKIIHKCDFCEKVFHSTNSLKNHVENEHNKGPFINYVVKIDRQNVKKSRFLTSFLKQRHQYAQCGILEK